MEKNGDEIKKFIWLCNESSISIPEFGYLLPDPSLVVSSLGTLCIVYATLIKYKSPIPAIIIKPKSD